VHPFLPALSIIFQLAADAALLFLHLNMDQPEVAAHALSVRVTALVSLLIGAGLAVWLRRFGLLYPSWIAILSLLAATAALLS